jgi:hypothetical protein
MQASVITYLCPSGLNREWTRMDANGRECEQEPWGLLGFGAWQSCRRRVMDGFKPLGTFRKL